MDLPTSGGAVDVHRFSTVVEAILSRTPLTDLATLDRASPTFTWRPETLALAATHAGRTVILRALAHLPERAVDAALGRATRQLFAAKALRAVAVAIDLLRDRALMAAEARIGVDRDPEPLTLGPEANDAAFAMSAGALAASHWIAQTGGGFGDAERKLLLRVLAPAAASAAAGEVKALLPG
jgi:hypothetical protein